MQSRPAGILLAFLIAFSGCGGSGDEEAVIQVIGTVEPAAQRVSEDEINFLLQAAAKSFGPEIQAAAPASERHAAEVHCSHPLLAPGPVSLQEAVRANQREACSRTARELSGFQRWIEEEGPHAGVLTYFEDWHLTVVTEDLVSLHGEVTSYSGGVHSNQGYRTRTFWHHDGETGAIGFEDLFREGSPWRDELCFRVQQRLLEAGASDVVSGQIPRIEERHLEVWSLTGKGIEFHFAPYEVGCFAEGSYVALVEYDRVRDLLDPHGPLARFAR